MLAEKLFQLLDLNEKKKINLNVKNIALGVLIKSNKDSS